MSLPQAVVLPDHHPVLRARHAPAPGFPRDTAFSSWADAALVWLPELGMGRLRVTEAPYDAAYWAKYEGYAATPMGRAITQARLELVDRHHGAGELVDVGIGCGDFVAARGGRTYGYDVNPVGVAWLKARERYLDPYPHAVAALSLWDVLEHVPEPAQLLASARAWVFVSVPLVPGDWAPPPRDWKHLRRDEHCWYWNRRGLEAWMATQGFELVEESRVEEQLGREDVGTFAFRRSAP